MSSTNSPYAYLDPRLTLSQIGSTDAARNLTAMLKESLQRDIPLIDEFLQQNDGTGANRLLHALKGVIPIFCGDELCSQVSEVEVLSKKGGSRELTLAYAMLRPKLELLLAEASIHLVGPA